MSTLSIKNMVCDRCIMTVRQVLDDLNHEVVSVSLGSADLQSQPSSDELDAIEEQLKEKGFELIRQKEEALIEQIKTHLISYVNLIEGQDDPPKLSEYLSNQIHRNYSYLSSSFSDREKLTIEQYLINLKIERVKELLSYREMTLSEIAWKLNYSSVQYLSNQFKKVTGETVSSFKSKMSKDSRQSLDSIST